MDLIKTIRNSTRRAIEEGTLYVDGKPMHDPHETPWSRRKAMKGPAKPLKPETLKILKDTEKKISEIPGPKKKDWSKMGTPPSYKVFKAGVDEALGTMKNISKSAKDAAMRSADKSTKPGDAPRWLTQAIKKNVSAKKEPELKQDMQKEEVKQVDETKMNEPQKAAVKKAIDLRGKIGTKTSVSDAKKIIKFVKNEEVDLEEGRGRPPKMGSKAWHAKQAAVKSGEGEEQEADKNIVNQMRKKPVGEHHTLTFNNGEKKQVHVQHVNKALSMLANTAKPADREKLQNSLSHSHDRFMSTIKSGKPVEDAARPKVSLGKMKAESVETSDSGPMKFYDYVNSKGDTKVYQRKEPKKQIKIENIHIEDENLLNKLYENLSEENKELFEEMITTQDGIIDLISFAVEQGIE